MAQLQKSALLGLLVVLLLGQSNVAYAALNLDAIQILRNLSNQLDPWFLLVQWASYVMGIAFFFKALYHLKVYGELRTMMSRETSLKTPLTWMVVGSAFIYFPTAVDIAMVSTFGEAHLLQYSEWTGSSSHLTKFGILSVFRIVQFVGLVSFVRGMMIIAKAAQQGQQQATVSKGFTHVIAGIFGLNIIATANMMSETLGINFS